MIAVTIGPLGLVINVRFGAEAVVSVMLGGAVPVSIGVPVELRVSVVSVTETPLGNVIVVSFPEGVGEIVEKDIVDPLGVIGIGSGVTIIVDVYV